MYKIHTSTVSKEHIRIHLFLNGRRPWLHASIRQRLLYFLQLITTQLVLVLRPPFRFIFSAISLIVSDVCLNYSETPSNISCSCAYWSETWSFLIAYIWAYTLKDTQIMYALIYNGQTMMLLLDFVDEKRILTGFRVYLTYPNNVDVTPKQRGRRHETSG